jgi:hypothetical protein
MYYRLEARHQLSGVLLLLLFCSALLCCCCLVHDPFRLQDLGARGVGVCVLGQVRTSEIISETIVLIRTFEKQDDRRNLP